MAFASCELHIIVPPVAAPGSRVTADVKLSMPGISRLVRTSAGSFNSPLGASAKPTCYVVTRRLLSV
jgi:hypothetical protein